MELLFGCNNAHSSGLFLENLKIESTLAHRPILVELLSKDHQTTNELMDQAPDGEYNS